MNWKKINRKTHSWGSLICALPILIVIGSGLLLILKKEIHWVQPPSAHGQGESPTIEFSQVLAIAQKIPELGVYQWSDIDKLDVRPKKGIIKIRAKNGWEAQIDHQTGDVLQVAYRRSDLIESIHDGSYFHTQAKLWLFLPASILLLLLWVTGLYLFLTTHFAKQAKKKRAICQLSRASG